MRMGIDLNINLNKFLDFFINEWITDAIAYK